MEDVDSASLLLSDLQAATGSLLVFCNSNDDQQLQQEDEQHLNLGTLQSSGNESEEPLWIVGNTIQFSLQDGGQPGETNLFGDTEIISDGNIDDSLLRNGQVKAEDSSGETIIIDAKLLGEADVGKTLLLGSGQVLHEGIGQEGEPILLLEDSSQLIPLSQTAQTADSSLVRIYVDGSEQSQPRKTYQLDTQAEGTTIQVGKLQSVADSVVPDSKMSLIMKNASLPAELKEKEKPTSLPLAACPSSNSSVKFKLSACSKSSFDEDDPSEESFVGPTLRWPTQPKSYRGAKQRDGAVLRKNLRKVPQRVDTDGETSGMGSSVDEPVESSTESASEAPTVTPSFLQPRASASRCPSVSPTAVKKRRGGWPKGRKRKPELPGAKPPKAPLTAYVLFLNERRKYYKEMLPDLSFGAVTKLLGAEWSSMTAEQKAAFITRSEQEKRRYRNELQAYRQSHDYQLLLRKKRIKNVIRRGGTTTEESSDFTDEIDDDESEELYCRICDQLFSSLHNKREHLYGKQHLQAITGEYQRERLAEEERQMAAASGRGGDCSNCGSIVSSSQCSRPGVRQLPPGVCPMCCSTESDSLLTHMKQSPAAHTEEDDHDGDEEDEEEEEEDKDEDEGEEKEETESVCGMSSMADALEGVMAKMLERDHEIKSLKESSEIARSHNLQLATTLLQLREQKQDLDNQQAELQEENDQLKSEADALWMLPALFGVTPLDMVNITLRQDNQQSEEDILLDVT